MARINRFFSDIDLEAIREYCMVNGDTVQYKKGDCFVEAGYIGRWAGFVRSGYFKYCVISSRGDYYVTGFSFKDECITDFPQSFLFDMPSNVSIIAGCDAEVVRMPLHTFREFMSRHYPELISRASAILLQEVYNRYLDIYKKPPTERYLELVEMYPDIFETVTLRDIASYLRITSVYLSRIRKNLGK